MKWPNHTDYQDAIQNPQVCFEELDLKGGEAVCDMLGLPRVMSGNFASVYELVTAQKRWAIRCFVRQVSGTQARYSRLGQHLQTVSLPWLVNFEFILKGILVQGDWYPIVKMEWVEGCPINTYVEDTIKEPQKLASLAAQFRTLVNDLRKEKLAHGDLQHGNIMVTPNAELRLVDYDGMYCPAFGKGRSPELGHANFQHPLRMADYYDESLDNFSALVIYTSLLALAADPGLWPQFYSGDNLIFSSTDFRNTQNSKLFQKLKSSPDPRVPQLAALLQQCCISPLTFVPWFEETLVALENGTLKDSLSILESEPAPVSDEPPKKGDGWWEAAKAHTTMFTRKALSGTRPGTRAAPGSVGTRPSAPVVVSGGSRPADPVKLGTRPSPGATSASGRITASGTRQSPVMTESAAPELRPYAQPEETESGISFKVKLAVAAFILLTIICIAVASRSRSAAPQTNLPTTEER
jgi:hypothetical protein